MVLTPALAVPLPVVIAGALLFSLYAGMGTDGCSATRPCDFGLINAAYRVAWGGAGIAVLITAVGIVVAAIRRRLMVLWPAVGWVMFLCTYLAGAVMLNAGLPG